MHFIRSILKYILNDRISIRKYHKKFIIFPSSSHLNLFLIKKYEQNIKNNILPFVKTSNLIFDIGANIGQYTLFFSDNKKKRTKIVSFEPSSDAFNYLQANMLLNNLKNVYLLNLFVSNKKKKIIFYLDNKTGSRMSSAVKNLNSTSKTVVRSISLNQAIKNYGTPDFLKIDIEGYEKFLFQNTKSNIFLNTYVLIEVNPKSKKNIYNFFANSHYCYSAESFFRYNFFKQIPNKIINLLFIPFNKIN